MTKSRGIRENLISGVDRNGREYKTKEMQAIFRKLYPISPAAILLMFPDMTQVSITNRANKYGIQSKKPFWSEENDRIARELHPDLKTISERTGRSLKACEHRCLRLGLRTGPACARFTSEEVALMRKGLPVPGRSPKSVERYRGKHGIAAPSVLARNNFDPRELIARIESMISRGYPEDRRKDAVQHVLQGCLEGRCKRDDASLRAAAKKAITAVYKMHPDRGAPTSLDAQIYEDGGTTVGDRIHSDAFHF